MSINLTARRRDKLIEAAQIAIRFTVEGRGGFPTDMLRYDHCWPGNSGESAAIDVANATIGVGESHTVTLRGLKPPTAARWASFGWRVVES